ncbi:hypothetical protein ColKHC_01950 [Colletotrichum higginsianum]|nr:hypothetical protein ColKHC_01950 [Colletotrichum higginsianum]
MARTEILLLLPARMEVYLGGQEEEEEEEEAHSRTSRPPNRPTGARSGRIPLDGNFGQGIPTGPISPSANANAPTSAVQTRTSLPPKSTGDRFVIFAGSSSKTFSVPSIRQGPVVIGLLAFWVFVVMVP